MGKFNLLTIMTLNAAGYVAGIDDAKKSTKALEIGSNQATTAISNSFGSIAGLAGSAVAPMASLVSAVKTGAMAFWSMIPAINGVSVAIIATGIGAIVIAIGLAFAALSMYLSGTSEGATKLKIVLASIGGFMNTILQRVKLFGSAMANMLQGNWKKMADDFNAAFASGFMDEAKKNAEDAVDNIKEEIALNGLKRKLLIEEADAKKVIAELDFKARDMDEATKEGAAAKLGYVRQEIALTSKMFDTKKAIADKETEIETNKQKGKYGANYSTLALSEDKNKLAEFQAARINLDTEFINWKTGKQKLVGKLQKALNTENDADIQEQMDSEKRLQDLKNIGTEIELKNDVKTAASKKEQGLAEIELWRSEQQKKIDAVKVTNAEEVIQQVATQKILDDITGKKTAKVVNDSVADDSSAKIANDAFYLNLKSALYKSNYEQGLINLETYRAQEAEAIRQANADELKELDNKLKKGLLSEKEYALKVKQVKAGQSVDAKINANETAKTDLQIKKSNQQATLKGLGDLGSAVGSMLGEQSAQYKAFAIGTAIISTYLAAAEIMANTAKLGPVAMVVGMVGTIAMGLANVAKISGVFAEGGIVGGSAFSGDNVHVRVNSGEMILNQGQQANLFAMANGGGAGAGGEVVFKIHGQELWGVRNNYAKKMNNIR